MENGRRFTRDPFHSTNSAINEPPTRLCSSQRSLSPGKVTCLTPFAVKNPNSIFSWLSVWFYLRHLPPARFWPADVDGPTQQSSRGRPANQNGNRLPVSNRTPLSASYRGDHREIHRY